MCFQLGQILIFSFSQLLDYKLPNWSKTAHRVMVHACLYNTKWTADIPNGVSGLLPPNEEDAMEINQKGWTPMSRLVQE